MEDRKFNFDKLIEYGFTHKDNFYEYQTFLKNNEFKLIIKISDEGKLDTQVIDLESNEEFLLIKVQSATGEFVGEIRKEYDNILDEIIKTCSEIEVFKSEVSKKVIEYVKNKYGDLPEFLWGEKESTAVFRHKENKKWYGVLLTIPESKLGLNSDNIVHIIDLKIKPEELEKLVDGEKYFPGYHMNKKHWITIILDGRVKLEEIFKFIDNSFSM